jgi:hypothetical protein
VGIIAEYRCAKNQVVVVEASRVSCGALEGVDGTWLTESGGFAVWSKPLDATIVESLLSVVLRGAGLSPVVLA